MLDLAVDYINYLLLYFDVFKCLVLILEYKKWFTLYTEYSKWDTCCWTIWIYVYTLIQFKVISFHVCRLSAHKWLTWRNRLLKRMAIQMVIAFSSVLVNLSLSGGLEFEKTCQLLLLQESCKDDSGSLVVYSVVDVEAVKLTCELLSICILSLINL